MFKRLILLAALGVAGIPATRAAEPLVINGITEPLFDVTLSASVPGIIGAELFKEGDLVRKGDVILELDNKLQELEVARRQAVMDKNKEDLDSTRVLVTTTKSVSKDELAKKEMDYNVSAAEHGIAAEELARRKITAPFSGSIAEISLHTGAACAPYQPLVRLVDISRCYFVGHVEGKVVFGLQTNQPVKITLEGAAAPVNGTICFISPVVDPASGLAKVKAIFDNADGKIRPGLAARLSPE
jgi:RND family efflux transporter MFP subunit